MRNNFTKIFALVAMSVMTVVAWGETQSQPIHPGEELPIMTELGSYLDVQYVQFGGDAAICLEGTNIARTHVNNTMTFKLVNTIEQAYYLTYKSGSQNAGKIVVTTTQVGEESPISVSNPVDITNTGGWSPSTVNYVDLGVLPVCTLTVELKIVSTEGGYAGNFNSFAVRGANQSSLTIDLSTGTHYTPGSETPRYESSNQNIGFINDGDYSIFGFFYLVDDSYVDMTMGITIYDGGKIQASIYDINDMNNPERQQTFDIPNLSNYTDHTFSFTDGIAKGFKAIRFDYIVAENHGGYILNYNNLRFSKRAGYSSFIKDVKIDGESLPYVGLYALRDNGGAYTFSENVYTANYPTVTAKMSDGSAATVTSVVDGTNVNYTITNGSDISSTLTVENVHLYTAGAHDEDVHLVYTSAGKTDDTWTNGQYSVSGERLDGNNNSVFKFSHMGNKIYTLSVPANIIVKQVILTGWNSSESTIGTVTSEGATVYAPTYYQKTGESSYNIVLNLDDHVAGTDIVMNMALAHQTLVSSIDLKVQQRAYWREHPHMNLNTICYPYQIDSVKGATFYSILSTEIENGNLTKLVLEEHVGALEAGVPYFYDPTEGADELVCYYSGAEQATPQTAADGAFVGSYDDNSPVEAGSYVTVNNQLYKCGSGVTMGEYRAYVKPKPYTGVAAPGRRILTIGGNKVPTAIDEVEGQQPKANSQKLIRNGQLFIIRDGKTYNAQGQIVK